MSTDNDTSSRQMTVALAAVGTLAQLSPAQLATFAGANVAEAIDISGDNSKDELAHKNDDPDAGPSDSCPLLALPPELNIEILRYCLRFNRDLYIDLDPEFATSPPFKYNFIVGKPVVPGFPPRFQGSTRLGPIKKLFAVTETNKELRALALEIFYKENKFVFKHFYLILGVADVRKHHFEHWKRAIGMQVMEELLSLGGWFW